MSMYPYRPSDYPRYMMHPMERYPQLPLDRYMARLLNNALDHFDRSFQSIAPYWQDTPTVQECNIGNAVGNIVNDNTKFGVQLDVSQFHPSELTVDVRGQELVIEGHHEERNDHQGKIERHFVRKYMIPDDVLPDTIESHLSDKGVLSVSAQKKSADEPAARNIPIKPAPKKEESKENGK